MSRNSNGPTAQDPFFERMMDERIATLRAFLRKTSEKYDVPQREDNTSKNFADEAMETTASSNVVPLLRAK